MSDIDTTDISHIRFSSAACPSEEDMKLWESLSPAQQRAVILRDLEAAEAGGLAPKQTIGDIIAEVRTDKT